ncbi:PREDICTED: putative cellulose synthase-like protein D6 [Camelina sativa]|uniref:Cellulose synthase-like protein D6 n=1 Tax=Camelina sativa TaxID=90675 RepID=A0ABM0VTV7_CAMSA|nr:PREDICTED: putative cellulose synthase-like protein D6 [Camelina sativa]
MSGESPLRHPRISHVSNSGSDFGSKEDYTSYIVQVPPTPDNNPASLSIVLCDIDPNPVTVPTAPGDTDSGSSCKDDEPDQTDLRNSEEEEEEEDEEEDTLLYKISHPLTRIVKISPLIIALYRTLIVVRVVSLGLFLTWRIRNPNNKAIWLWLLSVICEIWFAFSWLLDQIPKLFPVNHGTDIEALKETFEPSSEPDKPTEKSDLPGIDVFVSTADAEKEPPLVTANTILSILSVDYPVQKLSCYLSDDGGSLLTFEAMAEAASFAKTWVPFCRKHNIEPRNPESYFGLKRDPYKGMVRHDFVRDRRYVKRGYEEFKVRVNALSHSIRRRSDAFNSKEEMKALEKWKHWKIRVEEDQFKEPRPALVAPKATWMSDGTHWPGTWAVPCPHHSRGDHASVIQVLLDPPGDKPVMGRGGEGRTLDFEGIDIRLPMLVYVSREKRPGYDHNKKAGAMNALVRASAIMSNGPFILNLDCDHYVYNSKAFRNGICFMMDGDGDRVCYVQFPQRFEGIDPSDRYANNNTVFFDINLRALDGIQGPMYVGTGCLFRRTALYGFNPPDVFVAYEEPSGCFDCCFPRIKKRRPATVASEPERYIDVEDEDRVDISLIPKQFGSSSMLVSSVKVAEFQGRPLASIHSSRRGRPPGSLTGSREPLDVAMVNEAVNVISCWYEDKTEWGINVGWIYGSVTEDVVTGFRMHEKGWRSFYCVTEPDAFRGTAPINLTDRLHQVLRWATGSVEIFFSRNNAIFAGRKLKFLQRISYLNVGIYPFTSIFILTYCFLPPLSLFSGHFVVETLTGSFLVYLLIITLSLCGLAVLEVKWSGISLEEWWRNEQFWLIGGTSAHLVAVLQGILKVIAGIEISFTLTSKSSTGGDDEEDDFADLYLFKWTSLMILPLTIIILNIVAILFAVCRTVFSEKPQWSNLLGGTFFAAWVLLHMYPFAKGLMGRGGRTPTIVYVWSGLIAICLSLLYITIKNSDIDGGWFLVT